MASLINVGHFAEDLTPFASRRVRRSGGKGSNPAFCGLTEEGIRIVEERAK